MGNKNDIALITCKIRESKPRLSHKDCETIASDLYDGGFRISKKSEPESVIYDRIYKQTQKLATLLARLDGFDIAEGCEIDHKSKGRASGWWSGAVEIQELMNGHEMADIIDEIEEAFPEKFPTIEKPNREQQLEKALQSVIDLQKANYGDGMDTHMALKTLVDETLSPLLVKVGK